MNRNDWTDDKLISRLINNKTDKSRWDNIRALRKRPSQELFAKCVELTKSKNPKIRKIGIDILAQLGLPPRPFLKDTLKIYFDLIEVETDLDVLMSLLYSIGHNNDKLDNKQIEKICSFIDSENSWVKEGLVSALLGIDNPNAIETLIKLSADKLSHIRNWATFGLGTQIERNNTKIREALWERVNDKHQETKLEAIVGLAKRKDKRVNDIIKREIIGCEYGTLLFEAIIETQDKELLPLLKQNLRTIKDDKTINPEWEKDLKNCIDELTKRANKKRTTA
jgi:HEAT repeat protein